MFCTVSQNFPVNGVPVAHSDNLLNFISFIGSLPFSIPSPIPYLCFLSELYAFKYLSQGCFEDNSTKNVPQKLWHSFSMWKNRYFLKKWPISLGYIASLSLQFKTIFSPTELVISSSHKWPWYMVMPIRCREFTESADYSGRMFTVYQKDTPIQQESILVLLFNLMKRKSMKHIPQP